MHLQGYSVLMVQFIYMSAQEDNDAGTTGVLTGEGNNYSSGRFQLLPGVYWEWKLSSLLRVPKHVWQVIVFAVYGHSCNQASDLAYVECVVLL